MSDAPQRHTLVVEYDSPIDCERAYHAVKDTLDRLGYYSTLSRRSPSPMSDATSMSDEDKARLVVRLLEIFEQGMPSRNPGAELVKQLAGFNPLAHIARGYAMQNHYRAMQRDGGSPFDIAFHLWMTKSTYW